METRDPQRILWTVLSVFAVIMIIFYGMKVIEEIAFFGEVRNVPKTISVSGKGEVFAKPDIASMSFSIVKEDSTVALAQKKVSDRVDAIAKYLKSKGVEEKDITTTGYNIYPKYDYTGRVCTATYCPPSKEVLRGYEVNQSVTIKVRDIAKAGEILTGIGENGVTNVSGLAFSVDNKDAFKAEARKKAIDEAKAKMDKIAADLGVKVIKIMGFSESDYDDYRYPMAEKSAVPMGLGGAGDVSMSLPTGQSTISSSVYITYEIR